MQKKTYQDESLGWKRTGIGVWEYKKKQVPVLLRRMKEEVSLSFLYKNMVFVLVMYLSSLLSRFERAV